MSKSSGAGTTSRYRITRLTRDDPARAEASARGAYPSGRAAAKAAGLVQEPTPLELLHRYGRKMSPEDRLRVRIAMLTPQERRALLLGLEEEDRS